MANPLDAFPYNWPDPVAQALHLALCEIHPSVKAAMFAAVKAGIKEFDLNPDQTPYFLWRDILDQTARAGTTRPLVESIRDANKTRKLPLLDELLANQVATVAATARTNGAMPYDDTIGEREALLYRDDLTMSIGRVEALIQTLTTLKQEKAPAVCRLVCNFAGTPTTGTGFRIGPDLILTNWHVLHHPQLDRKPTRVTAQFDYEEDKDDKPRTGTNIDCDIASIVVGDNTDDWGVIRVATPLWDDIPTLLLSKAGEPTPDRTAFLIQHPGGAYKRIGYVRNQITEVDKQYLYYLTDTQPGSSGAPVFDAECRLVGLHHFGGTPQEVLGKPPLKKNRGIRIGRVVAGLAQANIAVP